MRLIVEFLITNHQWMVVESFKNGPSIFDVNWAILCSTSEQSFLRQISTGEGYSSTLLLHCHYYSISALYSHFSHLPPTQYHLKDQQRRNKLNTSPPFPQNYHQISKLGPPTISYVKQFISYILSQTVIWLCNQVCSVIHTQNGASVTTRSTI